MNEYEGWTPEAREWQTPPSPPARRRSGRRWLVPAVLALAFALTLGTGALLGSHVIGSAQAAGVSPGGATSAQSLPGRPGPGAAGNFQTLAGTPGAAPPGQCGVLTVSSVSGNTITAKAPDGSTVTIHTTASTVYDRAGQTATASAVTVGSQISVQGTRNSDGSITATRIDIR